MASRSTRCTSAQMPPCTAPSKAGATAMVSSPPTCKRAPRALQIENALRRALERQQFEMHYPPRGSLRAGQVVGAEALLRWRHPELGVVAPVEFIPVAENSGQIVA